VSKEGELDFTRAGAPAAPPSPEQVESARKEANTGGPQLAKTGFYVAMARHASAGRVPPRDGVRHCILVVEDDMDLLKLVGEVLSTAGYAVRFARNRTEINGEFNTPPLPDLVLLDVRLPDADGFQILEKIRGNRKLAKIPVVMMTGKSEVTDVARGLALGADGYVTKPFKISGLVSAVNTVLGNE
jgi:CheY-like chemotaxis protein